MTPEWLAKLFDALKSSRLLSIGALVSAAFLWFPHRYLPTSATVPAKYGVVPFLIFAVCMAGLIINSIRHIWKLFAAQHEQRKARSALLNQLTHLTPDEKYVLQMYVTGKTVTQYLEMDNGVVGSLLKKRMLYVGSRVARYNTLAVNISADVYKYLTEHMELLDGSVKPQATAFERMRFPSR